VRALVAFLLLGAAVLADDAAPSDPLKLAEQLASSDVRMRRDAAYFLEKLGPKAKPALPALIKGLDDPDKQVWSNSVAAIAGLGPDAAEAIPALLDDLNSKTSRASQRQNERDQAAFRTSYALTRIGPAAIAPLIEALRSDDTMLRAGAAKALGGMGPAAKDALPALLENLGHGDAVVTREVADALGAIGATAKPKIVEALAWKESRQRSTAALALAAMGKTAADTAPALLAQLEQETDSAVRISLLTALPRIGAEPAAFVPKLIDGLKDDTEANRHAAINGLLSARTAQKQIVTALTALLRDPNPVLSERAAYVLGRLGEASAPAVPAMVELALKQTPPAPSYLEALVQIGEPAIAPMLASVEKAAPSTLTREHWAVQCLAQMGGVAAVPVARSLTHQSANVRLLAVRALAELGPDAESSAAALMERLDDADLRVRGTALVALAAVGTPIKTLQPRLETAFKDNAPAIRGAAVEAALRLGNEGKVFQPAVAAALKDKDPLVRQAALGALGPDSADAVPSLIEMLRDAVMRPGAIDALGRIGPAAKPAAAALGEIVAGKARDERLHALQALAKIGPAAQEAQTVIATARQDAEPAMRTAAITASVQVTPDNAERIAILTAGLEDGDIMVRRASAELVGKLGDKGVEAAPKLVAMIEVESDREFVLTALDQLPPRNVGLFTGLLAHARRDVRILACQKLGRMGRTAREAIPALEKMTGEQDEELSRAARRALRTVNPR